jgi:hypothetical protein
VEAGVIKIAKVETLRLEMPPVGEAERERLAALSRRPA